MKKEYQSPLSSVLAITTGNIVTASEGDTIQETVSEETTIDGDDAWSRRKQNRNTIWDTEEEEPWNSDMF